MFLQIRKCINQQNQEYYIFLYIYCDADHARDIYDRISITSTSHLFNVTIIDWCTKKNMIHI